MARQRVSDGIDDDVLELANKFLVGLSFDDEKERTHDARLLAVEIQRSIEEWLEDRYGPEAGV